MEETLTNNNILEPLDPLNISFSVEKCKPASSNKTRTPDSSNKNDSNLILSALSSDQSKENTLIRDPQSFFGTINVDRSHKKSTLNHEKDKINKEYYTQNSNLLKSSKTYQDSPKNMRRVHSLKKEPFSEYNSKINIIENYQQDKTINKNKQQVLKLHQNISRLRMISSSSIQQSYMNKQRKKYSSIDKRIENPTRFRQLFNTRNANKVYIGNFHNNFSQPIENIDWKTHITEIQRLNCLINKVDSYIKYPGTPSNKITIANQISANKERNYKLYGSNIWKNSYHKYKTYGTDRRILDQYMQQYPKKL